MGQLNEQTEVIQRHPISGTASVAEIRHAVRDCLDEMLVDPSLAYDCLVAVTEACTNALVHGKRNGSARTPSISWRIDPSGAEFFIEDFSHRGWRVAEQIPVAKSGASPIAGRVGGFGLHLMADLMDEMNVGIGAEGTRVTLIKRFAAVAS